MAIIIKSESTVRGHNTNAMHAWVAANVVTWTGASKARPAEGRGLFAPDITASVIPG